MSGRVPYPEAGAAHREAARRACAAGLTAGELRVAIAVLGLLASYSKVRDRLTLASVAAAAGVSERHARRALGRLELAGVLRRERSGGRLGSVIAIPGANPDTLDVRVEGRANPDTLDVRVDAEPSSANPDIFGPQPGHPGCPPPEKTEKVTTSLSPASVDHIREREGSRSAWLTAADDGDAGRVLGQLARRRVRVPREASP